MNKLYIDPSARTGLLSPSYANVMLCYGILVMLSAISLCIFVVFVANNLGIHVKSSKLVYCLIFMELAMDGMWAGCLLFLFISNHKFVSCLISEVCREKKNLSRMVVAEAVAVGCQLCDDDPHSPFH